MQGQISTTKIGLGGLAPFFSDQHQDKRTVLLVDHTGNAYTFFKYKARLIDCAATSLQIRTNYKKKEDVMQQVRKGLAFGIKHGQVVVLHLGQNVQDWDVFFKGQKFWNPKKLFAPCNSFDTEWFKANVSKPQDIDMFGNKGPLYPNQKFLVMISFTKQVDFKDLKWLSGCSDIIQKVVIN